MVEKKIKGRKRHIITDTEGFILGCYVGAANENDRDGVLKAIDNMKGKYTQVTKLWADMGYQGKDLRTGINDKYSIDIEVIKRPPRRFWIHQDTLDLKFKQKDGQLKELLLGQAEIVDYQKNMSLIPIHQKI